MSILRNLERRTSISETIADASRARYSEDTAGIPVTASSALTHTAVFSCIRLLAEGIASLPAAAFRKSDEAVRHRLSPQPKLLVEPHRDLTVYEWRRTFLASMVGRGNAYGLVTERDRLGYPTQLTPLDPDTVRVEVADDGSARWTLNGKPIRLVSEGGDLVHFAAFQLPGSPLGISPVGLARTAIGIGLAAEQFAARWFRDGAAPSSVLESEKALTPEQSLEQQARWIAAHGSGDRTPAVLSGGLSWKPISITPEESQFLETQKFSVSQVARIFGVPPHMIGDVERSTSWGSGIEQQHIGYLQHTLTPWIQAFDGRLSALLPRGQYARTNVTGLLRADTKTRYQTYTQARMAGILTTNEIRAFEELEPVEGGDELWQPLNMAPLGEVSGNEAAPGADDEPPTSTGGVSE